jgi:Fic family protein
MPYMHWDELRYRTPPAGLTHEEWWALTKLARRSMQRNLPLLDQTGGGFVYALTDQVLREVDYVTSYTRGLIGAREQVTNPATRDQYLVSSLIEEAITSSQLEGASTSHKVAKEMIRSGRPPRDRSERMILNNYHAMQRVGDLRTERLTLDLIKEIHRVVTDGTLDDDTAAGRFQRPDEDRVSVFDQQGRLLYTPPPANQIEDRLGKLCEFANAEENGGYLPGVLRAITVHFMLGYEHPFEDGNGRTARALFYWAMLNRGYWLTEFLSVSRILKAAPAKYARSYLFTESDESDLTYFFTYQLRVLHRSIEDLNTYVSRRMTEVQDIRRKLSQGSRQFNTRQLALLNNALRDSGAEYSVQSHMLSHRTSMEAARKDLVSLERAGLLDRARERRRFVYRPVEDLAERIKTLD